jgi:hypothetical protein
MPFAAGFIIFFYLDIFISVNFTAIGMMPMAFLITAVSLFVSIVLIRSNPVIFDHSERRLNRMWIFSLIVFALIKFISNLPLYLAGVFGMDPMLLVSVYEQMIFALSAFLLAVTLLVRHKTVFHRWQVFCAFSIFIQAVLPVTIWRLMPVKVYAFYGLIQMPMIFGMLMLVDSLLKRRFGFNLGDRTLRVF